MFSIIISYSTGDSFKTKDVTTALDSFKLEETANENARRIAVHYKWYASKNKFTSDNTVYEKPEFVKIFDRLDTTGSIYFINDEGNEYLVSPEWCGYFENLHTVEVVESKEYLKYHF